MTNGHDMMQPSNKEMDMITKWTGYYRVSWIEGPKGWRTTHTKCFKSLAKAQQCAIEHGSIVEQEMGRGL